MNNRLLIPIACCLVALPTLAQQPKVKLQKAVQQEVNSAMYEKLA